MTIVSLMASAKKRLGFFHQAFTFHWFVNANPLPVAARISMTDELIPSALPSVYASVNLPWFLKVLNM